MVDDAVRTVAELVKRGDLQPGAAVTQAMVTARTGIAKQHVPAALQQLAEAGIVRWSATASRRQALVR